jgi:nitroreductase
MELLEAIRERRAVREYTDAPVGRSVIERLIDAAIQAPSAMNLQPWAFAVLLDRERIGGYARRAKSWLLDHLDAAGFGPSIRRMLDDPAYVLFHNAPALVLVLAKTGDVQAAEDCCLAAQNLMLAAREQGLGSCWIGLSRPWLNLPETKAELHLPAQCRVVAPIVLGYPKAWPEPHGRAPAEIHWLG